MPHQKSTAELKSSQGSATAGDEGRVLPLARSLAAIPTPFMATCIDAKHPTLSGRIKLRLELNGERGVVAEGWALTLHGQTFRAGDRVFVQRPTNTEDLIVLGVIDGFLPRPELERHTGPQLELKRDEALRVNGEEGQPLVEIVSGEEGPVVRLLHGDVRLELKGKLSIRAAELELEATRGNARVEASDRVCLVGELVELN
jgi:hypothetical protein